MVSVNSYVKKSGDSKNNDDNSNNYNTISE